MIFNKPFAEKNKFCRVPSEGSPHNKAGEMNSGGFLALGTMATDREGIEP